MGDRRVSWVAGLAGEGRVVFDKDRMAVHVQRAKVVLFIWVVRVTKLIVERDGPENSRHDVIAKRGNARCYEGRAITRTEVRSQLIIEGADHFAPERGLEMKRRPDGIGPP